MLKKILLFLFIIGAFGSAYIQENKIKELDREKQTLIALYNEERLEKYTVEERLDESRLYNKFTAKVEEISQDPWAEDNNCYDHSKALQQALKKDNIASSIFITPTRDHAFIAVWIEATTGNFIKPDRYELGEARDYNLKVICQ